MLTATGIFIIIVAVWFGFMLLRRALRLAVKLAMAGVVVALLIIGALALWLGFGSNFRSSNSHQPAAHKSSRNSAR
jgi:thiol:disulfide interchange protein